MILAINTTTSQFGIAFLEDDGTVLAEYYLAKGEARFGGLMPALSTLMIDCRIGLKEVECIAVATGPGSFTGLRVGMAAAKGLCHGLGVPIMGISSLEALAYQSSYGPLPVTSLLYSRKEEVFAAQFQWDSQGHLVRTMPNICSRFQGLSDHLNTPSLFIGNNYGEQVPRLRMFLAEDCSFAPAHVWGPRPVPIGVLGLRRYQNQDVDDPKALRPIYLRPPDIRPSPFPAMTGRNLQLTRGEGEV